MKDRFVNFFLQHSWNIGFVEESLENTLTNSSPFIIHWLKHDYSNRWFADPFILGLDDENIYVLVEDFLRSKDKAHISLLTIDRKDYRLKKLEAVLEEPTHLSFPIYYINGNKIMMYPENGASGSLKMYEFDAKKRKFQYSHTIILKSLADAVFFSVNDVRYLIATEGEDINGKILNFYRETEPGYELVHQVKFDKKIARNAGAWFTFNGKYYRPAQNCELRYGAAMEIQEFNPYDFSFKTIRRIEPSSKRYSLGIHTFNHYNGISVVDGYGYDRASLAKIYIAASHLKNIFP